MSGKHPRRRRGRRGRKRKPTMAPPRTPSAVAEPSTIAPLLIAAAPLPDIRSRLTAINALRRATAQSSHG